MSSILKALRKLEEEKANRGEGSLDIARDVLRRPASRRRPSAWRRWGGMATALLLLGAVGWGLAVYLAPAPPTIIDASRPLLPAPEPAPLVVVAEAPAAAAEEGGRFSSLQAEPEVLQEVIAEPPMRSVPVPSRSIARASAPISRSAAPAPTPAPPAAPAPPEAVFAAPAAPAAPPPPVATASAPAGFTVSAIFFQDDPEARLAVVNDLPVMLGTDIDGATVVDILPALVRFTRDGRSFAVALEP